MVRYILNCLGRVNEGGLCLPAKRANWRILKRIGFNREGDYLVDLQGQFVDMLREAVGEGSDDMSVSRLSLREN